MAAKERSQALLKSWEMIAGLKNIGFRLFGKVSKITEILQMTL
jgi:hypothetical protein